MLPDGSPPEIEQSAEHLMKKTLSPFSGRPFFLPPTIWQGLIFLGILLPILLMLTGGAYLTFWVKNPVIDRIARIGSMENDLYSVIRNLSSLSPAKETLSSPLAESRIAGVSIQIQSVLKDATALSTPFSPLLKRDLSRFPLPLPLKNPALEQAIDSGLSQAELIQKGLEGLRKQEMARLRKTDRRISTLGTVLTAFFFLFLSASFIWIRDYWSAHRTLALREAFNHSANGIAFIDLETRAFLFANEGFLELSGHSMDNLSLLRADDLLAPASPDPVKGYLDSRKEISGNTTAAGAIHQSETRFVRKNGTVIPVSVRVEQSLWEGRNVLIEIVSDQTVRNALFEKNRAMLEHVESMIKNLGEGLIELSPDGVVLSINTPGQAILGYDPGELLGQPLSQNNVLVGETDEALFYSTLGKALSSGVPREEDDLRFRKKKGTPIEVSVTLTPFLKKEEKGGQDASFDTSPVSGVILLFRNIHKRKEAQRKLVESEEKYRRIVESSPDGIYILDPDTLRILDANRGFVRMMGYTDQEESIIGASITAFSLNPEAVIRKNLARQAANDGAIYETVFRRKDRRRIPLALNGNLIPYQGKEAFLMTVRDVTEKQRAEAIAALFLEIDQRLLQGGSIQGMSALVTRNLMETFPFVWVALTRKDRGSPINRLRSVSARTPALSTLVKELHPTGSDPATSDRNPGEYPETAHFIPLDRYPDSVRKDLQRERVGAVYVEPVISQTEDSLGSIEIGLETVEDITPALFITLKDIARKLALATLQQRELSQIKLLEKAFEMTDTPMFITDSTGVIKWTNPAYISLTGSKREEVLERQHPYFAALFSLEAEGEKFRKLAAGETVQAEFTQQKSSGSSFLGKLWISPILKEDDGAPEHLVCIELDITREKKEEEELREKAYHDPLTHLPNRAFFETHIDELLAVARRYNRLLAVLFLDLDGFKTLNDTYGHEFGDLLLVSFSERITSVLRKGDFIYRLGGDEFIIILNNAITKEEIILGTKRILAQVGTPFLLQGKSVSIGASIGIATYPEDSKNEGELLRHSDMAMYEAKQAGKNRFVFFSEKSS